MRIYISGNRAWNSTFFSEDGDALYQASSPKKMFGRTTTIHRVDCRSDKYVAQFTWKTFQSAKLRFRDKEVRTRSFFRKKGWSLYGRDRVFEVNGCQFRWMLGSGIPELRLSKDPKVLVARYYPKGRQEFFTAKTSEPYLEIMSGWKGIQDEIVMSFIYIEKLVEDD
ncbi:hypothetical protein H0H92_008094 [Tricholoma furcatifolium]|nr:hypothetical protein H0H92_008094 [Tricholoma furcatifolium]